MLLLLIIVMKKLVLPLSPNMDKKIIKYWDDFFFWFIKKEKDFSNKEFEIQNKRQYRFSNFEDIEELKEYLDIIKNLWKKTSFALNHTPNSINKKDLIKDIEWIEKNINPNHYIVKDEFLMNTLIEVNNKVKINISSLKMAFNSNDILYLIDEYWNNIDRIIFHRDVSVSDVDKIIDTLENNKIKMKYEIFVANEWCYDVDWFCSSTHNPEKSIPFVCFREMLFDNPEITKYTKKKSNCYACSLFNYKNIDKIDYLKIPWRWHWEGTIKLYSSFVKWTLENTSVKENVELNKTIFWEKYQNIFCKSCIFNELHNKK